MSIARENRLNWELTAVNDWQTVQLTFRLCLLESLQLKALLNECTRTFDRLRPRLQLQLLALALYSVTLLGLARLLGCCTQF